MVGANCHFLLPTFRLRPWSFRKDYNLSMTLSLDKPKLDNLAKEIFKSAERLRGKFKAYEYQNV